MVLLGTEGHEVRKTEAAMARRYEGVSLSTPSWVAGRNFGTALQIGGSALSTWNTKDLGNHQTLIFGRGDKIHGPDQAVNCKVVSFRNGSVEQCWLEVDDVGTGYQFVLRRADGFGGVELARSQTLTYAVYYYWEIKVTFATSATGAFELRLNEVQEFAGSSVRTALDSATCNKLYHQIDNQTTGPWIVDDAYYCSGSGGVRNDFQGDCIVEGALPTSDGASSEWSPSSGTNHSAMVDDPSEDDGDATYLSATSDNKVELFNFADLSNITTSNQILGVDLEVVARLAAAGSRKIRGKLRDSGGTIANGADRSVTSTSFDAKTQVWEQRPTGSPADFTVAEFNADQLGFETVP